MTTLKEFSDRILRPSTLRHIEAGHLDYAIQDPDVISVIKDDKEIMDAIEARIALLQRTPRRQQNRSEPENSDRLEYRMDGTQKWQA